EPEGHPVRTFSPKAADVQRQWHVIDANDVVLGRLAAQVAVLLRGKHKQKFAYRHSGFPGGLTAKPYGELMVERPDRAVEKAVRGMLPHTTLGRAMLKKLKVYSGPNHPHQAQAPVPFEISQVAQ